MQDCGYFHLKLVTSQDKQVILHRLLQLVRHLYAETEGLVETESDLQLWYNRGYANGMVLVLREKGYVDQLEDLIEIDPDDYLAGQDFLPWGKAYRHGYEMGGKEAREVL